ncbi:hypothetical protein ABT346_09625 [Micromonospora peucetia]
MPTIRARMCRANITAPGPRAAEAMGRYSFQLPELPGGLRPLNPMP